MVDERMSTEERGTVARDGTCYTYDETTPEGRARHRQFLQGSHNFVTSRTHVVPTTTALKLGRQEFEKLNDLLGDGATAALLVAEERDIPLYADDLGLSRIAANEHGVRSFWMQALLLHMKGQGGLTDDEYHDAIRLLLLGNYYNVFFTVEDVKLGAAPQQLRIVG